MKWKKSDQGNMYCIKVKETVDQRTMDWFGELAISPLENGETLLVGRFADQPALRGFLDQLWNLNFTVLSVEKIGNQNEQGSHQPEKKGFDKK